MPSQKTIQKTKNNNKTKNMQNNTLDCLIVGSQEWGRNSRSKSITIWQGSF